MLSSAILVILRTIIKNMNAVKLILSIGKLPKADFTPTMSNNYNTYDQWQSL